MHFIPRGVIYLGEYLFPEKREKRYHPLPILNSIFYVICNTLHIMVLIYNKYIDYIYIILFIYIYSAIFKRFFMQYLIIVNVATLFKF